MREKPHQKRVIARYDKGMKLPLRTKFFGESGYSNFGYWTEDTQTPGDASRALLHKLMSYVPNKTGAILDVACGLGASTRDLLDYYPADSVTAINISRVQLDEAGKRTPGVKFIPMDAARLRFKDGTFQNVICVEAAFHFRTRERFIREAFRVLAPGGRLVTSDILGPRFPLQPKANRMRDPSELRGIYESAGFEEVQIDDATDECWRSFRKYMREWPRSARRSGLVNRRIYLVARLYAFLFPAIVDRLGKYYVLTSARKPA